VLAILKYARSFVGIDSSLAHATNAFDLPGVILFGDSNPATWGHDNNINLYTAVRCSPCYYYVWNHPCPYGHECMESITVEDVKKALLRQLARGYALHGRPAAAKAAVTGRPVRPLYPSKVIPL
jgi:ADP-heptose:LPS heptosyltransferase